MYTLITVTLLFGALVSAAPQEPKPRLLGVDMDEEIMESGTGEHLPPPEMYDSTDEDPNDASHAEEETIPLRRRRSPDVADTASTTSLPDKLTQHLSKEGMETAETAIFQPAFLRLKKKRAIEECRQKNGEFVVQRRASPTRPVQYTCNDYCCYYTIA